MDLRTYQERAALTDRHSAKDESGMIIPLLGLAGEAGELLTEYKKRLRDGESHTQFRSRFAEELGDVLWYVANLASKLGFDLDQIADENLGKSQERWGQKSGVTEQPTAFDEGYPDNEKFPRKLLILIKTSVGPRGEPMGQAYIGDKKLGDHLTDNAYVNDGYRYHDTFHFAFAAVLGWSPITRWLLNLKRRSRPNVDEIEDGARAKAAEEAISLFVFSHAKEYNWLEGKASISSEMLRAVKRMANGLEVSRCKTGEWEDAIIQGFAAWRFIHNNNCGLLTLDLDRRTITASQPGESTYQS